MSQLEELYVVPALRGRGIGAALLSEARRLVKSLGSPEMHINVDEVDADARRFYERHAHTPHPEDGEPLPGADDGTQEGWT